MAEEALLLEQGLFKVILVEAKVDHSCLFFEVFLVISSVRFILEVLAWFANFLDHV